jgi:hypothetical protein
MSLVDSILAQAKTLSDRERHELIHQLIALESPNIDGQDFETQMTIARAVMAKRKKSLEELAKS